MSDVQETFEDPSDPELRAMLADAADFLLPLAHAHVKLGKWPMTVPAWLTMVRDSLSQKPHDEVH